MTWSRGAGIIVSLASFPDIQTSLFLEASRETLFDALEPLGPVIVPSFMQATWYSVSYLPIPMGTSAVPFQYRWQRSAV